MAVSFFEYIAVMLLAGAGGFGGGIGGANIIKEFALNWAAPGMTEQAVMDELLNVISASQFGGYSQGITLAAYLGAKTSLGILGAVLGVIAFILPSVLLMILILKIGERLYKNSRFKYSINYINLLAAGLICMIVWNYAVTIFERDLILPVITGLACFASVYFRINPAFIIAGGALIGAVWPS